MAPPKVVLEIKPSTFLPHTRMPEWNVKYRGQNGLTYNKVIYAKDEMDAFLVFTRNDSDKEQS